MTSARKRLLLAGLAGAALCLVSVAGGGAMFVYSSSTPFCISCHEMQVVAEQGWMYSPHYSNSSGVVAQCADCHVPPEPLPMVWTKTRDGLKDTFVHLFGESDPRRMDWEALGESARGHIPDSACTRCHENLVPAGASIKMIVAHREAIRLKGERRCLDCHTKPFHRRYRAHLGLAAGPSVPEESHGAKP